MNIKFYAPKRETIPTRLRLKVCERDVYYERVKDKFAYDFQFFDTEELAKKAIDEAGEERLKKYVFRV